MSVLFRALIVMCVLGSLVMTSPIAINDESEAPSAMTSAER